MASEGRIKTRILIISDTHGAVPHVKEDSSPDTEDELNAARLDNVHTGFRWPLPEADVVLHCGDLTTRSTPKEFNRTFDMIRALPAPLKIVIPGNHDGALDPVYWAAMREYRPERRPYEGEARRIIKEAKVDGVIVLDEGVHSFTLSNGARLKVYASQWTPSYGSWGFQYSDSHVFDIPSDVDVAMTHGPPYQVLDLASNGDNAGCKDLFRAIHDAKPQIHCFGHIHEAWGGYLAKWKEQEGQYRLAPSVIDAEASRYIKTFKEIEIPYRFFRDDNERDEEKKKTEEKRKTLKELSRSRGVQVDLTGGRDELVVGEQTLFVNAAIMSNRYRAINSPWLVDLNLPAAASSH